ncbi:predicted protein [Chaetoceros tenuissimus]|uniref:Uncharacterized protein n=1 Tax=Chaetoceros tenuissimus TaxID=426638 RepID=A0AAD3CEH5_9STRA|nr:predicted protein [Chaetoceros tenuissimus]
MIERYYTLRNQDTVWVTDDYSYERNDFGDTLLNTKCFFLDSREVEEELSKCSRDPNYLLQRETILAIIDQIYNVCPGLFFDILAMENNSDFNVLYLAIHQGVEHVEIIMALLSKLSPSDQKLLVTKENTNKQTALMIAEKKKHEANQVRCTAKEKYLKKEKNFQNLKDVSVLNPQILDTLADNEEERDEAKRESDDAEEIYSNMQAIHKYLLNSLDAPDTHKDIVSDPDTSFCSDFSGESESTLLEHARSPATFSDGMYEESGYSSNEEIVFKRPRI